MRGYKFSTYAYWWIRQGITRAINNYRRIIRLPVHLWESIDRIKKTTEKLSQEIGRLPNINEIAIEEKITVEKLEFTLESAKPMISMDVTIGSEEESTVGDLISSDGETLGEKIEQTCLKEDIKKFLECTLNERELDVIRMRYGLDDISEKTLQEIGDKFHLTRERIRQIEIKAMNKLKTNNFQSFFVDYLYSKEVNINQEKHPIFGYIHPKSIKKDVDFNLQPVPNNNHLEKINSKGDLIARDVSQEKLLNKNQDCLTASINYKVNNNENLFNAGKINQICNEQETSKFLGNNQTMSNNFADLKKQFESLQKSFYDFQTQLFKVAESFGVSPQQPLDEIVSISELKSLLETVEKAEEKQNHIKQIIQEALTVLEKVLRLSHQNNNDFQPLVECQEKAQELKQQFLRDEVDTETQVLSDRIHPFSELLRLIEDADELDDEHLDELEDFVTESFTRPLSRAALRGKLVVGVTPISELPFSSSVPKGELALDAECVPENNSFVKSNPREKLETELAKEAIAPLPIKNFQEQPTVEVIPEKTPVETVTPLPNTEAPEEIETEPPIDSHLPEDIAPLPIKNFQEQPTVEVIPEKASVNTAITLPNTELPEEIEAKPPLYNYSPEDTAQAIAKFIIKNGINKEHTSLCDLIWQLIREQQLSLAYHLASAVELQYPSLEPHLPSWLIRALAFSQHLRSQAGEIAYRLKKDFSSYSESLGISEKSQWNQAVMLLLAATSLRPALLAPNTGASNILHQLRLGELNALYNYCQIVAKYGDQHLALEPNILKKATDRATWQKASDELHQKIEYWWSQAPQQDMTYKRANKVWER